MFTILICVSLFTEHNLNLNSTSDFQLLPLRRSITINGREMTSSWRQKRHERKQTMMSEQSRHLSSQSAVEFEITKKNNNFKKDSARFKSVSLCKFDDLPHTEGQDPLQSGATLQEFGEFVDLDKPDREEYKGFVLRKSKSFVLEPKVRFENSAKKTQVKGNRTNHKVSLGSDHFYEKRCVFSLCYIVVFNCNYSSYT